MTTVQEDAADAAARERTAAEDRAESLLDGVRDVAAGVRAGAERVAQEVPALAETASNEAGTAIRSLQTMPESTLGMLAAASLGMGAGLYLAAAPRLITIAALAPAGAVIYALLANQSLRGGRRHA